MHMEDKINLAEFINEEDIKVIEDIVRIREMPDFYQPQKKKIEISVTKYSKTKSVGSPRESPQRIKLNLSP